MYSSSDINKIKSLQSKIKSRCKKSQLNNQSNEISEIKSPFVPTTSIVISKFISLIKLNAKDVILDIGCGDGRIILTTALLGIESIGIENNISLFKRLKYAVNNIDNNSNININSLDKALEISELAVKLATISKDIIPIENFTETNDKTKLISNKIPITCYSTGVENEICIDVIKKSTVVFLYMLPNVNSYLLYYLLKYLPIGARIVCYTFPFRSFSLNEWISLNKNRDNFDLSNISINELDITKSMIPSQIIDGKTTSDKLYLYNIDSDIKI